MSPPATVPLGEVAGFIRGINFKPDDVVPVGTPGSVACMRTKNVQAELGMEDVWGVPEMFVRRDEQMLRQGDVLVSSANSWNLVGKCCWIPALPWRASFGGFVSVLRATTDRLDTRYLYRWFASERVQALLRSFGQKTTNISNLNIDRALALSLPLPPLQEQRRIAAILDQAETLRAQRRAAIAQLDSLGQAIFLEMFGDSSPLTARWPRLPLVDVCEFADDIRCGPFGTQLAKSEFRSEGVPLWGIRNVNALFELPTHEFLESRTALRLRQYSIEPLDIVMTRKGTVGNCAVYPRAFPPGIMHSDLLRIRVSQSRCDPIFLSHQLHYSSEVQRQLSLISGGAIMPGINVTRLKSLYVLVPSVALQQTFAKRVESIEQLRAAHRTALDRLNELFASLQHRAFRGELIASEAATHKAVGARAADPERLRKLEADTGLEALIFVAKRTAGHDLYASLKTLYMADKKHLEQHGRLIYGETYNALPMGPVPEAAYRAVKFLRNEEMFSPFDDVATAAAMKVQGKQLIPLRNADLSKLDSAAIQSLESAIHYFAGATFDQVKAATHDAAYHRAGANRPIPIEYLIDMLPPEARQRHRFDL